MKKLISFIKNPWVIVLVVILIIVVFFASGNRTKRADFETEIVSTRDLREIVSELGVVEAEKNAILSFGTSGVISEVIANEGESVKKGDVLARLSTGPLQFRVEEARARLMAEEARLSEITSGLSPAERIVAEQTLKNAKLSYRSAKESRSLSIKEAESQVESARRALYSSGLSAYLVEGGRENSTQSYVAPTISGTYLGRDEGSYDITLYPSHSDTGYSFRYTGLESGVGSVSTIEPQPLGKEGLYIIFSENFARNADIKWRVDVPNLRSPNYTSLKNALDSATLALKNTRERSERSIAEAEASLNLAEAQNSLKLLGARAEQISAQSANVIAMRALLNQAEASASDSAIFAPFDGIIAKINLKAGSRGNPGQEVMSIVGQGEDQITIFVPETDIARIDIGDSARIRFDAFRGEEFTGKVTFVSPVAITEQGLTKFKVVVKLNETPSGLRTGLSADIDINAEELIDVLAVPSRAVVREDGRAFVRVKDNDNFREAAVSTGLRSTDGYTEIISGLSGGEEIITYISSQELARLEKLKEK